MISLQCIVHSELSIIILKSGLHLAFIIKKYGEKDINNKSF